MCADWQNFCCIYAFMKNLFSALLISLCASTGCLAQSLLPAGNFTHKNAMEHQSSVQDSSYDIFIPIGKYLSSGDVESLSAWFSPALELSILGNPNDCSKNQARQILKAFFKSYQPRSFTITHQAGRENMKYALGNLNASGEHFIVTVFVFYTEGNGFLIQQLKIDRID